MGLNTADYNPQTRELLVRGKGNKKRMLHLNSGAEAAVTDWLVIRGEEPGPLFVPINKGGSLQLRRMTDQAVYSMLRKRAGQAGVKPPSPHDLRRTFVSQLLDAGADIATVQKLAGHANIQTPGGCDNLVAKAYLLSWSRICGCTGC